MSKVVRSMKAMADSMGDSVIENKVRNATSNDPWGPFVSDMADIARWTYGSSTAFYQVVNMLDKRLNDKRKNWRQVLKSLKVLDYCLHEGSELVVFWARENIYIIKVLQEFYYVEENGRDVGQNVRVSAKELTTLILDEERLRAERADRGWRSSVTGIEKFSGSSHVGRSSNGEQPRRPREHSPKREVIVGDLKTMRALKFLEVTKKKAEEESRRRERQTTATDAEVLRQAARRQGRTLGQDHEDWLATTRLLQGLQLNPSLPAATTYTTQQAVASRLSSFFSEGRDSQELYTDPEISEISTLLKHSNQSWSKFPRTYIVLRTIGHLNLLNELIDNGFSDYWFPVTERNLPGCLLPSIRTSFVRAQSLVLTKSLDLEKGHHCYYKQGESPPFETKAILGRGGFGQVDRVLSLISFREYARKQVPRSLVFRGRRMEDIKMFINEIEILKGLHHHHIVELIGSYTDSRYMALVMSPVAEMDLATYLTRASESTRPELRTFFGCLATALEYLHARSIRHKDIKPANILVDCGKVLFVDFGLSFDFTDADGSTTMSMVNGMTPRYCAPEVAQHQPRNTMSDIWSLGVVFMEMIVVLKGNTSQDMNEFFMQHGSREVFIRTNLDALSEFIAELEGIGCSSDNRALGWTRQMLSVEQQLRPTASSLVASILTAGQEGEGMSFCGICCVSPEDDFSDCVDEYLY